MYQGVHVQKVVVAGLAMALGVFELEGGAQQPHALQEPVATFRSSVDVVPISATVRDRRGRLVTTLTADDFEVLDKGERRDILDFQVDRSSPITLAVLVDVSGSMQIGSKLAYARQVLKQLLADLQEGRDEVGLFTFDSVLREDHPFTPFPKIIDAELSTVEPFGTTSLYDAIAETARRLDGRQAPRRAIVVLTDGIDTSSALTPPEVSGLASSIDVPVYVVVTVPPIDQPEDSDSLTKPSADLRDLAFWTGGDLLWASTTQDGGLRARQIMLELRHQYLIAIESASAREWRPIDLRVRDPRLTVRARSGYFGQDGSLR
jgi:VWFA-related protein